MDDYISRQKLLKDIEQYHLSDGKFQYWVEVQPSADVPQWIPCSERLPEKYGEYICTMQDGQVQECGFVPTTQKGLIPGWSTCEADGYKFLWYEDVIAWMPLPEPYKEGKRDGY